MFWEAIFLQFEKWAFCNIYEGHSKVYKTIIISCIEDFVIFDMNCPFVNFAKNPRNFHSLLS